MCCHGNKGGRKEGEQGKEEGAGPIAVSPPLCQEQCLQVVAEGDGDDREVGGEGEDGKEREKAVTSIEQPGIIS